MEKNLNFFFLALSIVLHSYKNVEGSYQGKRLFLIEAVQDGNMEVMKWLLKKEAIVDINDENGRTPLMFAAGKPDGLEFVKTLLDAGADPDLTDVNGTTCFHFAAINGVTDVVDFLKERVVYPLHSDSRGRTAVHMAAENGNVKILTALLEDIQDVENMFDKEGFTPVHLSAGYGHLNLLEFFKNQSVNLEVKNEKDGSTPLSFAAYKGSNEAVTFLVNCGSDINILNYRMRSPLHEVCRSTGNVQIIEFLIKNNATIDNRDIQGRTPLHSAVSNGLLNASKLLSAKGADMNLTDFSGNSMMHAAAQSGNVKLIIYLFEHMLSPEIKNKQNVTPLIMAIKRGHLEAVKVIVKFGGDLNTMDESGFTSMHAAAVSGNVDLLKYLLETGVGLTQLDDQGMMPLHYAVKEDKTSAAKVIIEAMSKNKMKQMKSVSSSNDGMSKHQCIMCYQLTVAKKDSRGRTPMYLAAENGHLKMVETLAGYGGDCKINDNDGDSPFQASARNGKVNVMQFLALQNCGIDSKNKCHKTALYMAAEAGQSNALGFLITNGANVSIRVDGKTAMHAAAMNGHLSVIKELEHHKDLVNSVDNVGKSPAWYAAFGGHLHCLTYFISLEVETSDEVLVAAVKGGHLNVVRYLVWKGGKGSNIESVDSESRKYAGRIYSGFSLLQIACQNGSRDIAEFLIERGADMNITTKDTFKRTLLHLAAQNGRVVILDLLLSLGMDINARDDDLKETPLHYAAKYDQVETLKFLLDNNANVNLTNINRQTLDEITIRSQSCQCFEYLLQNDMVKNNSDGKTFIHIAVEKQLPKFLHCLVDSEESVNIADNQGNRPIHYSVGEGNISIIKILLDAGADVNVRNKDNQTPLGRAIAKSLWSAAKCFLKYNSEIRQEDINMARRMYYDFYATLVNVKNGQTRKNLECK